MEGNAEKCGGPRLELDRVRDCSEQWMAPQSAQRSDPQPPRSTQRTPRTDMSGGERRGGRRVKARAESERESAESDNTSRSAIRSPTLNRLLLALLALTQVEGSAEKS